MYSVLFWLEQNSVLCSWVSNKLFKGTHVSLHVCRCTPKGVSYGLFFSNLKEKLKTVQEQSENSLHKHCSGIRFLKEATIYVPFFFFSWYHITCGSCSPNLRLMVSLSRNTATNSFCPFPLEWIRCRGITENNVSILQKLLFQHLREGKPNPFSKSKVSETEWNTTEGHKTHHACCRDRFIRRMNCAYSPLLLFPSC